jgi:hypothetical protein
MTLTDPGKSITITKSNPHFSIKVKTTTSNGSVWLLKEIDRNLIEPIKKTYVHPHPKSNNGYEEWFFKVHESAFKVPTITDITLIYVQPVTMQIVQGNNFKIIISP